MSFSELKSSHTGVSHPEQASGPTVFAFVIT